MKRRLPLKVAQHIIIHSLKDEKFSLRMKVISFFSLPFHALECVSVLFSLSIPLSIHGLVVVIHVTDNDEGIPSKRISWWRWFSAKEWEWEWEREVSSTRKTLSRVYIHVSCIYLCVCSVFFQMLTWLLWNCIHVHKVCVCVCECVSHSDTLSHNFVPYKFIYVESSGRSGVWGICLKKVYIFCLLPCGHKSLLKFY